MTAAAGAGAAACVPTTDVAQLAAAPIRLGMIS
jgi:hypothetical protein